MLLEIELATNARRDGRGGAGLFALNSVLYLKFEAGNGCRLSPIGIAAGHTPSDGLLFPANTSA
jgi:hypothetical protein